MGNVNDLLNSLSEDDISAYLADAETEEHIFIGDDRFIIVPDSLKRIAVQYDHHIETVTFDCPRYWDEHDMSEMVVYINYLRPDGIVDYAIATNVVADEENPRMMHFDWTVTENVTQAEGTLVFLVCIKGPEGDHWNSELCKDMYISEGLEPPDIIEIGRPDVLTQVLLYHASIAELNENTLKRAAVYVGSGEMPDGYNVQVDPDANQKTLEEIIETNVYSFINEFSPAVYVGPGPMPDWASIQIDPTGTLIDGDSSDPDYNPYPGGSTNIDLTPVINRIVRAEQEIVYLKESIDINAVNNRIALVERDIEELKGSNEDVNLTTIVNRINKIESELKNLQFNGLTSERIAALDNMFKIAAYIKEDASAEYEEFKTAFGIGVADFIVTRNLTNVILDNASESMKPNSWYYAVLSPIEEGYTITNVTVTMGGIDITETAYSDGSISIEEVTGDIVITATAEIITHTITTDLTNVTSDNDIETITHGSAYTSTLTLAGEEYAFTRVEVMMDGINITSEVYADGVISIPAVTGDIVITVVAQIIEYLIGNNLTDVVNTNASVSVKAHDSYTATLKAIDGYIIDSVTITMGGVDITNVAYSNGVINITSVTDDIVITATGKEFVYTITNNLTKVNTNKSTITTANPNSSYTAKLTPSSGYVIASVSVVMGDVDITEEAFFNNVITIPEVTGDIVITSNGVTNKPFNASDVTWNDGWAVDPDDGILYAASSSLVTSYVDISGYSRITAKGNDAGGVYVTIAFYDADKVFLSCGIDNKSLSSTGSNSTVTINVPAEAKYAAVNLERGGNAGSLEKSDAIITCDGKYYYYNVYTTLSTGVTIDNESELVLYGSSYNAKLTLDPSGSYKFSNVFISMDSLSNIASEVAVITDYEITISIPVVTADIEIQTFIQNIYS